MPWKPTVRPFENPPVTAQWDRKITYDDYTKMLQGFQPQSMDDKWLIFTDTPEDADGNIVVHAYWGRYNKEEYAITVVAGDFGKTDVKDWATIVKIAWKVEQWDGTLRSEDDAKESAVSFCRVLLKCAMEE